MSLHDVETGNKLYEFPLELGTIAGISGRRHHTECFYSFCSFLTPNTIYRVKFNNSDVDVSVSKSIFYKIIVLQHFFSYFIQQKSAI